MTTPIASPQRILVVDCRPRLVAARRTLLAGAGYEVLAARSAGEALAHFTAEPTPVVLLGAGLPEAVQLDLVAGLRERDAVVGIVVELGARTATRPADLLRAHPVQGCLREDDGPERLLGWLAAAARTHDDLQTRQLDARLKNELLGSASHELRTPINVILGYADLLRDGTFGTVPPEATGIVDKVVANASYLLELIEEFMDFSKLEAGATSVRRDLVPLGSLLRELGESFSLIVRTKPVRFHADIPADLPPVLAEPQKLRVVLQNLLGNAAKFTREGEIHLAAAVRPDGGIAITVADTGPGIPPEQHEAIFEIFHQLGNGESTQKGVGLGLALARRFTRLMNGDITVESTVGRGTTFTVLLPPASVHTPAAAA